MSLTRADITDDLVRRIGAGIRQFNAASPPGQIRFRDGVQVPPTPSEQVDLDQKWHSAIRHGLYAVAEPHPQPTAVNVVLKRLFRMAEGRPSLTDRLLGFKPEPDLRSATVLAVLRTRRGVVEVLRAGKIGTIEAQGEYAFHVGMVSPGEDWSIEVRAEPGVTVDWVAVAEAP